MSNIHEIIPPILREFKENTALRAGYPEVAIAQAAWDHYRSNKATMTATSLRAALQSNFPDYCTTSEPTIISSVNVAGIAAIVVPNDPLTVMPLIRNQVNLLLSNYIRQNERFSMVAFLSTLRNQLMAKHGPSCGVISYALISRRVTTLLKTMRWRETSDIATSWWQPPPPITKPVKASVSSTPSKTVTYGASGVRNLFDPEDGKDPVTSTSLSF